MAFRTVQVAPEAIEIAELQSLAQSHETQFADDPFLEFEDARAFFESTTTRSACDILYVHHSLINERLKTLELFCSLTDFNKVGKLKKSTSVSIRISISHGNGKRSLDVIRQAANTSGFLSLPPSLHAAAEFWST